MPHLALHPTPALLLSVVIVLILLRDKWPRGLRDATDQLEHEFSDALRRMPVFSAETTRGKEAEFIRDRLPKRFPTALVGGLLLLFMAAAWWLTR